MNPFELMKNLQQMQSKMQEMQEKVQRIRVEGRAGGDMVKVLMDGTFKVLSVTILPAALDPSEAALLQDLIVAAMADAHDKVKASLASEMASMGGGMPFLSQMMGQQ